MREPVAQWVDFNFSPTTPKLGQWPILMMEFEWDASKSDACYELRGFDFAYVTQAFLDPRRLIRADQRHSYGEDRFQLFGMVEKRVFVVVYTPRSRSLRLISARKANTREIEQYENGPTEN